MPDTTTPNLGLTKPEHWGSLDDWDVKLNANFDIIDGLAKTASPIFTGDPTAPTPATADNDNSIATTAFVKAQGYAALAGAAFSGNISAPQVTVNAGSLIIDRTGDATAAQMYFRSDVGFAREFTFQTGTSSRWALRVNNVAEGGSNAGSNLQWISYDDAGVALATPLQITRSTGIAAFSATPTFPTATAGDNTTKGATTAFVTAAIAALGGPFAPLASPAFTGNPTAPTPAASDNDTSIATTAFVTAAVAAIPGFTSVNVTMVAAAGAGSYTKPAGLKYVEVWCVGGGGGSANTVNTAAGQSACSGGGGGGAVCMKLYAAASLAASTAYNVGAGGAIGTAVAGGGDGGNTTFAGLSAGGGSGCGPSLASAATVGFAAAGLGGTATGGDINIPGGEGGQGTRGTDGAPGLARSGIGGGNVFASQRQGLGTATTSAGGTGYFPGGGARGSANAASQAACNGGLGSVGMILFREYF